MAFARMDDEGEVIRKQPKNWVQAQRNSKRDLRSRVTKQVTVPEVSIPISTPKTLAGLLGVRAVDVLKMMIKLGESPRSSDETIGPDLASLIAKDLNFEPVEQSQHVDRSPRVLPSDMSSCSRRPPLVTVIGHIDHGKTTLLDVLRNSNVVEKEAGRITQHIGAFTVKISDEENDTNTITFMDTPGHEAFTSLRERGVKTTDIALLVVAADNGVQEQTIEAIRVAKASGVQMMVCITKIDKVSDGDAPADTRHLREQLFKNGVEVEGFRPGYPGVPCIEVSAKTGRGIEELKAAIIVQAEILNLRAPTDGYGEGFVLESKMEKGKGALATVLVTAGTIYSGDWVVVGTLAGKIKIMMDHERNELLEATPGFPVEIIGLKEVAAPGTHIFCVASKELAERMVQFRQSRLSMQSAKLARHANRQQELQLRAEAVTALTEETGRTFAQLNHSEIQSKIVQIQKDKESQSDKQAISILIKADVAGSIEGVQKALSVLPQDEIGLQIVKTAVGPIIEADVTLAKLTGAYVVAFNMKTTPLIQALARERGVIIIENNVVYSIVDSIKNLMTALLPPSVVVDVVGEARVRDMFEINKGTKLATMIAGCVVTEGQMRRGTTAQVVRGEEVVHEAALETLRSFKHPVPEVRRGNDCGLSVTGFGEFVVGDVVRCISKRFVPRKLGEKRKEV